MLYRTVIGLFCLRSKIAGRKFAHVPVIFYALAAYAFAGTGFIAAITDFQVLLFSAFHIGSFLLVFYSLDGLYTMLESMLYLFHFSYCIRSFYYFRMSISAGKH